MGGKENGIGILFLKKGKEKAGEMKGTKVREQEAEYSI